MAEPLSYWAHEIREVEVGDDRLSFIAADGSEVSVDRQVCEENIRASAPTRRGVTGMVGHSDSSAETPYIEFACDQPVRILFRDAGPCLGQEVSLDDGLAASRFGDVWFGLMASGWGFYDYS